MSQMIEWDRCKKKMYADSRSDKGAWSVVNTTWIDGYSTLHLCRDCHSLFLIDFLKLYSALIRSSQRPLLSVRQTVAISRQGRTRNCEDY